MKEACESRDLIQSRTFWWMWALTAPLVAAQFLWPSANGWFAAVLLLAWSGFCASNAWRCGRLHCYVTAPVCALGALYLILAELGVAPFRLSWQVFNWVVLGPVVLACLAEGVFGRYARRRGP